MVSPSRCRGKLDEAFFKEMSSQISMEKFKPQADEDRLAELEMLKTFLEDAVKKTDEQVTKMAAPADRLKKLLAAQDKKAMLLEMAGKNEIDRDLIKLLDVNIESAKQAQQPQQVIDFLTKVKVAASKYVITT